MHGILISTKKPSVTLRSQDVGAIAIAPQLVALQPVDSRPQSLLLRRPAGALAARLIVIERQLRRQRLPDDDGLRELRLVERTVAADCMAPAGELVLLYAALAEHPALSKRRVRDVENTEMQRNFDPVGLSGRNACVEVAQLSNDPIEDHDCGDAASVAVVDVDVDADVEWHVVAGHRSREVLESDVPWTELVHGADVGVVQNVAETHTVGREPTLATVRASVAVQLDVGAVVNDAVHAAVGGDVGETFEDGVVAVASAYVDYTESHRTYLEVLD